MSALEQTFLNYQRQNSISALGAKQPKQQIGAVKCTDLGLEFATIRYHLLEKRGDIMINSKALKCRTAVVAILVLGGGALGGLTPARALTPASLPLLAKPAPPETPNPHPALDLVAHNVRTDRAATDATSLRISNLYIQVDIVGHMAQTTILATFTNKTNNPLEGDFSLQLPAGAYVTGYALDLRGQMVDGVLQSRLQAREAYETQLRKGIDPGLAEVDSRNLFRTHVFPIFAGAGRTVRVTYVTPLAADGRFDLPLTTAYKVGQISIKVMSHGQGLTARAEQNATLPELLPTKISNAGNDSAYAYTGSDVTLNGTLRIHGVPSETAVITQHQNGEDFFEFVVDAEPTGTYRARSLRLYWDASRSHRDDDVRAEAQLVADYVSEVKPSSIDLVLFADEKPTVVHFDAPTPEAILKALQTTDYAGATRFEGLPGVLPGRVDICLVVSDGHNTLGGLPATKWPCRVMTLTASKATRRDVLKALSENNGGAFVDLGASGHDEALKQLLIRGPRLWAVEDGAGKPVPYMLSPIGNDQYRVIGPAPKSNTLVVSYADISLTYDLAKIGPVQNDAAGALWGAHLIDQANTAETVDPKAVLALARHYSVATPEVSFLVLEFGRDYAEAGIAPPADIDKAVMKEYLSARDELAKAADKARADRFDDILTQWSDQKTWYTAKYLTLQEIQRRKPSGKAGPPPVVQARETPPQPAVAPPAPIPAPPVAENSNSDYSEPPLAGSLAPPPSPPPPRPAVAPTPMAGYMANSRANADTSVLVAGARRRDEENGALNRVTPPQIEVSSAEWHPEKPYLKALEAVKTGDQAAWQAAYRGQEKIYGDTPGFYFDVAEWLFRKGLGERAISVARNALELPASDIDTQIILASRLIRYGDTVDAISLDEHIVSLTPEKPQATRNLALALIDATDHALASKTIGQSQAIATYKRALGLFMKVVLTPWDPDYDGIEIISLMEANHLVSKLNGLGVSNKDLSDLIDPRLVDLLDVDIRITLEWNTDDTDMDLWMDEPSGERVIYNNPKSQLGGRLSNDMTSGYGPEEYLLHNAPKGTYNVLANVYAADQLNRNGATSITVRLYRDWGRPTEKMESFVVDLLKDDEGGKAVGTFTRK
jgi:hypothetical protein